MKLETLIKAASNDWSAQAQVPPGLADRVLRRSRRNRHVKIGLVAGSTAIIVGTALAVGPGAGLTQRSSPPAVPAGQLSTDSWLQSDPGTFPPRRLVAAGDVALAAYDTGREWHLYNPASGQYEKTSWAYLDVAAGMRQAAVLEGPLPTSRVGILDMNTQKVTRWIKVDHPVGGVAWAPDGRRLVLTTYDKDPDENQQNATEISSLRTGFYIVDAESKLGSFHRLAGDNKYLTRQDFRWSRRGTLLSAPTSTFPAKKFYDLDGNPRPAPAHEDETNDGEAGLSPNGTLLPKFGPSPGPAVTVTNVKTGKAAAILPIEQAIAWADDEHLIAISCDPKNCSEFHNRFLLVGLDGKITPLTGYHDSDGQNQWKPVFAHR